MKHSAHTVRRTTNVVEVTDVDIRAWLQSKGMDVHPEAKVYVRVPGGGDWSNMMLVIGEDANVVVEWDRVT